MKKRRQHYVWQNYLKPFCYAPKMIYCLFNHKIKGISTKDIAVEKDIYKLKELTEEEIFFLLKFFEATDFKPLNDLNNGWVEIFSNVFRLRRTATIRNNALINSKLDELEQNLSEDLHMYIENTGSIFLESLYRNDTSFFYNDNERSKFIHYFMVQYFRTKKMKEGISSINGRGHFSFDKAWNVMVFIMATNVAMRISVENNMWELLILQNNTSIPFITSDQPIINLYSKDTLEENANLGETELELYYPITPQKAVVLKIKDKSFIDYNVLSVTTINYLNTRIKRNSYLQVYSNSEEYLEALKNI